MTEWSRYAVWTVFVTLLIFFGLFSCMPVHASSTEQISTEKAASEEPPVIHESEEVNPKMSRTFSAAAADTTWQNDFKFYTDNDNKTITLRKYTGKETDLVVKSRAVINGTTYKVILGNNAEKKILSAFSGTSVRNLSFESGVQAADEPRLFYRAGIENIDLTGLDTSKMTTMEEMFSHSGSLKNLVLTGIDSSQVRNMRFMFSEFTAMTSIDVSMLDLSKVQDMEGWFYESKSLTEIYAGGLQTPALKNGLDMFLGCLNLKRLNISDFDFSKLDDTQKWSVFKGCGLEKITINNTILLPSSTCKGESKSAFLSWNTKADGSGRDYFQGQYCQEEGAVTLYSAKHIPTGYTALGVDGYELYKNGEPGNKEYVYCLNQYLEKPTNHQFAAVQANDFGGFSEEQKLMLAAAILMKDHADGADLQYVIWRITDGNGSGSKSPEEDEAYYQYIEEHCEELKGVYEMNFYICSDSSVQNLLSVQQVRVPTSLKIAKKLTGGNDADQNHEYTIQLALTDGSGNPLTGSYTVKCDGSDSMISPDGQGNCSISLLPDHYAVIRNLPVGTKYKVTEDGESVQGFEVNYTDAEGTIESDKAKTVTVTNTVPETEVDLSKQDIAGSEIEGAKLEITQGDVTVDSWMSEKDKSHRTKLKPGDYVLHESGAPDGFIVASDISFTVTKDHKVIVDEEEKETIVMTDMYETGSLCVKKTVTGSMGDRSKKFDFTVRLERDGKPVSGSFPAERGTVIFDEKGEAKLQLAHGESVTITGIRTGTAYTVTEDRAGEDGYTTDSTDAEGTISRHLSTASYTNTRKGEVPAGADTGGLSGKDAGTLGVLLCAAFAGWMTLKRHIAVS